MPSSLEQLKSAIDNRAIEQVALILNQRDSAGRPRVDINAHFKPGLPFGDTYDCTIFQYVLSVDHLTSEERFRILELLLSLRDAANNPVIDLNIRNALREDYLEHVLSLGPNNLLRRFNILHLRTLVDRIINLRFNDGRRVGNFSQDSWLGTLFYALGENDPEIVRSMIDLRNADGSLIFDVNKPMNWGHNIFRFTALDYARGGYADRSGLSARDFRPNPEVIEVLTLAGARTYSELRGQIPLEQKVQQEEKKAEQKTTGSNDQVRRFNANPQNVHSKEVEKTVDISINNLKERYEGKINRELTLKEMEEEIVKEEALRFYAPAELVAIKRGFQFVKRPSVAKARHAPTGLDMIEILSLVWLGANDKQARPEDNLNVDIEVIIKSRKRALLDQFNLTITTYGSDPENSNNASCIGGTRNRLLQSLHKAHPDVAIAPNADAAREVAFEALCKFEKKKLLQLSRSQQLAVLVSWDKVEEPSSQAFKFHRGIREELFMMLMRDFSTIVAPATLQEWTTCGSPEEKANGYYDSLPRPLLHPPLKQLIETIDAYVFKEDGQQKDLQLWIKSEADELFSVDRGDYERDYTYLQFRHDFYLHAIELLKKYKLQTDDLRLQRINSMMCKALAVEFDKIKKDFRVCYDALVQLSLKAEIYSQAVNTVEDLIESPYLKDFLFNAIPASEHLEIEIFAPDSKLMTWLLAFDQALVGIEKTEKSFNKTVTLDEDSFSLTCAKLIKEASATATMQGLYKIKENIAQAAQKFTKTERYKDYAKDYNWSRAFQILKNVLLCFPVLGWACLFYRAAKRAGLFFTVPSAQSPIEKVGCALAEEQESIQSHLSTGASAA